MQLEIDFWPEVRNSFDNRVDVEALAYAARALPAFTFALVGRVNPDQVGRLEALRPLKAQAALMVARESGAGGKQAFQLGAAGLGRARGAAAGSAHSCWMYRVVAGDPRCGALLAPPVSRKASLI